VQKELDPQPRSPGQEGAGQPERNTIDVDPRELPELGAPIRDQRERSQEVLTKLAPCHPGRPLCVRLERKRIDEDRLPLVELDVVGTRVLERHAEIQSNPLDLEGRERRILEFAKAPLVGIRDERQRAGPKDPVGGAAARGRDRDFLVGDQQSALHQRVIQPRRHQPIVICRIAAVDLPVDDAVALEYEPTGIAKRRA